jgi:phosphoenolpyruvate carboxylase
MTKSIYISKEDLYAKNDIKYAMKYYDDSFFWNLRNISTQYNQKIELIVKLHKQMIYNDNFSMGIAI